MKHSLRLVLLAVLLLAAAGTLVYWWGLPQLTSVYPANKADNVKAGSEIRLAFSRTMQPETVIERLVIEPATPGRYSWESRTLVFQPNQPWKAGMTVRVRLTAGARTSGALSFHMRQGVEWSFRIRQAALAYLYPYPAKTPVNIYSLNPLSGESTPLTGELDGVIDFSVAASGSVLYYSAKHADGSSAIYRLDLDAAGEANDSTATSEVPSATLVWDCPMALCRLPSVSPQGDTLAFERTAHTGTDTTSFPQVWLLSLAPGGEAFSATPRLAGEPDHLTLQPAWSRTGWLSFYDRQESGFVLLNPSDGHTVFFANQTFQPGAWDPSGRYFIAPEINFLDTNISEGVEGLQALANSHLILFDSADGTTHDLTLEQEAEDTTPVFSPDGRWLAFTRKYLDNQRWTPGRQVWLMDFTQDGGTPSGSQARPLTAAGDYHHYDLAWNPDGDQLAYVRLNQTAAVEPLEIWLLDPLSGRSVKLITGGYAPTWIP